MQIFQKIQTVCFSELFEERWSWVKESIWEKEVVHFSRFNFPSLHMFSLWFSTNALCILDHMFRKWEITFLLSGRFPVFIKDTCSRDHSFLHFWTVHYEVLSQQGNVEQQLGYKSMERISKFWKGRQTLSHCQTSIKAQWETTYSLLWLVR